MRSHRRRSLTRSLPGSLLAAFLAYAPLAHAQTPSSAPTPVPLLAPAMPNQSLRQEVQHSIDEGLAWLKTRQNPGGWWSNPDYPALTALVVTASFGDPARNGAPLGEDARDEGLHKAHAYMMNCVQPDGGIYRKGLSNYNTSISLVALLAERDPRNDATLRRARRFVLSDQRHAPEGDPTDGGFTYDPGGDHADVSNTVYSLEALHLSQGLAGTGDAARDPDLDTKAAVAFLQRCQNLPGYNKEPWATGDAADKGGFIYESGNSKATAAARPGEPPPKALRSYGTMTYAGLLSYIYADLKPGDPRVQAAHAWLLANYTLDDNPGMGKAGLYYYYELMAKALAAYGAGDLDLPGGRKVDWREELATKLLSLQTREGYWQNDNGRWWEKDPVLATAYSLIALEFIYRRL